MALGQERPTLDDLVMQNIFVGVDGSDAARKAVDWALSHASKEDVVTLVHTWSLPAMSGYEMPAANMAEFETAARRLVSDLATSIKTSDGPHIQTESRPGHAGPTLAELSADADLVVVGSRGYGGFKGLLLGSVSTYLVHHAGCPVVIVRD